MTTAQTLLSRLRRRHFLVLVALSWPWQIAKQRHNFVRPGAYVIVASHPAAQSNLYQSTN